MASGLYEVVLRDPADTRDVLDRVMDGFVDRNERTASVASKSVVVDLVDNGPGAGQSRSAVH